ncbi:MAG: chloride channel protein [Pseudomonadota bacterium]
METQSLGDTLRIRPVVWVCALVLGIATGFATIGFRIAIEYLEEAIYGASSETLASHAATLDWWVLILIPTIGGLIVGLILQHFTPDARARTVAHAIEGAALNDGRVEGKAGLASTLASLITLGTGGSSGREGPAIHIGALISSKVSKLINADGLTGRDLLGCTVAAAVAASFNAPLAGALFALEVVLRHYTVRALAPIMIAAVAGSAVSRLYFGNITEFFVPLETVGFIVELPAFMTLGVVAALVAVVLIKAIFWAEDLGDRVQSALGAPAFLRPMAAGFMLGCLAIYFPHIIGVGYETTSNALTGQMTLLAAILFAVTKGIAVTITLAGRMGGGVFSPSLMMGALTGLAFGWIAVAMFPSIEGDETLYALAGMGAVAAAILGAPLSTTLIVFELTGDWQAGLSVMVAVAVASAITNRLVHRSYFITQLERRNVRISLGPQAYLLSKFSVASVYRTKDNLSVSRVSKLNALIKKGIYVRTTATLDQAMPLFESGHKKRIPVVAPHEDGASPELVGALYYVDALDLMNKALAQSALEEHA